MIEIVKKVDRPPHALESVDEHKVLKKNIYISDWNGSLALLTVTFGRDKWEYIFTCLQGIDSGSNGTFDSPEEAIAATINSGKPVYAFYDFKDMAKWMAERFPE